MAPGASATSCVCRVLLGARESEARSSACRREEGPRNGPGVCSLGVDLFQPPDGEGEQSCEPSLQKILHAAQRTPLFDVLWRLFSTRRVCVAR